MHIHRYANCINAKSVLLIIPGVTLDNTIDTRALDIVFEGKILFPLRKTHYTAYACTYFVKGCIYMYACMLCLVDVCCVMDKGQNNIKTHIFITTIQ